MSIALTHAEIIGDNLALRWGDGVETIIDFATLRRACPCATCGGEPDVLGRVDRPHVIYHDESFRLKRWLHVGGYALQFFWADGHSTGIYSFDFLRRLAAH